MTIRVTRDLDGTVIQYDRRSDDDDLVDDLVLAEDLVPGKIVSVEVAWG